MGKDFTLDVDGRQHKANADPDMPLLDALRDDLGLNNPHFGCGLAQCGSCTVHLDGQPIRSCVTPVAAVSGRKLVTLEGLATAYFNENPKAAAASNGGAKLHPVQQAWIDAEVPQCGYCQNGWIMYSASILGERPGISDADMKT